MRVVNAITSRAGQFAGDVQDSLRRARVEGERRLLQRQHRVALEELGLRSYELVRAGELPEDPIAAEVAAVESKLIEIEAKVEEIERLRRDEAPAGEEDGDGAPANDADDDPALAAFPMIKETPPAADEAGGKES